MQMGMTGQDSQHRQLKGEPITNRINTKTALCFTELPTFSLSLKSGKPSEQYFLGELLREVSDESGGTPLFGG